MDGARIRAMREAKQMNREYLAHLMGVTVQTIFRWETDRTTPNSTFKRKLRELEKKATVG